jgi:hypothetical protein
VHAASTGFSVYPVFKPWGRQSAENIIAVNRGVIVAAIIATSLLAGCGGGGKPTTVNEAQKEAREAREAAAAKRIECKEVEASSEKATRVQSQVLLEIARVAPTAEPSLQAIGQAVTEACESAKREDRAYPRAVFLVGLNLGLERPTVERLQRE